LLRESNNGPARCVTGEPIPRNAPRASCLYEGWIVHRRRVPVAHTFRYRLSLMFVDLAELPALGRELAPLWAFDRRALITLRRRDYFGDPTSTLDESVRELVEQRTGKRPGGAIRLLTGPRLAGYSFNPASFYYCHDTAGAVTHVVAEVTNTPWLERHCYVLSIPHGPHGEAADAQQLMTPKELHVSPFFGMDQLYRWDLAMPGERLSIGITNYENDEAVFDAQLALSRVPLTRSTLLRAVVAPPLAAFRVTAAIYFQALRLRLKGAPYHSHPSTVPSGLATASSRCRADLPTGVER
jgi:uncharacterized protein